jgi:hypothetical protein
MTGMRQAAALLAVLLLAGLVAGCGKQATKTTTVRVTETVPQTTTTTPTTTEAAQPPGPAFGTAPVTGPAQGTGLALLSDVRVGAHEGFDRIVFEFEPGSRPGYTVRYTEPPIREDPSDRLVRIGGNAFLSVRMFPASGFDLTGAAGETYTGPARIDGGDAGTEVLVEVVRTGDFEAVLNWVAGVEERVPFRVLALSGPPRIVVDVLATG